MDRRKTLPLLGVLFAVALVAPVSSALAEQVICDTCADGYNSPDPDLRNCDCGEICISCLACQDCCDGRWIDHVRSCGSNPKCDIRADIDRGVCYSSCNQHITHCKLKMPKIDIGIIF